LEFWNRQFDPDKVIADVVYLGTLGFNDAGTISASFDGTVDIDVFVKNVVGGSGAAGTWEANGLVYGAVAKGGNVPSLPPGVKRSNVFVSELGTKLGGWSVPGGSLSHMTFFSFAAIPEPSSALLGLTVFLVGLASRRRRRP
jgi:hypothetical protein|tara:strand:- start:3881 stop:4306 length:426 start_codon:yes stop_codon:yes gene_type:complete